MDYAVTLRATVHAQDLPHTRRLQGRTRRNEKSASVGLIKHTKNGFVAVQRRAISWSIVSGGPGGSYVVALDRDRSLDEKSQERSHPGAD
jgi:hypothetical protein